MKRMKILLILLVMFAFSAKVFAVCDDEEMKELINSYEVYLVEDEDRMITVPGQDEEILDKAEYGYVLLFYPDSSDLVYKVTSSDGVQYAKYSYKYETYMIGSDIHFSPKNYKVEVYGREGTACSNEKLLEKSYLIPAYNEYSGSNYCREHKEEEICKINYDSSKITDEDKEKINGGNVDKEEKEEMTQFEKIMSFVKKALPFILIPILIISLFYIVKIKNYKKKESRR